MNTDYYEVWLHDIKIASHMLIEDAIIFIKALFNEYYNDKGLAILIKKEED